MRALAKKQPYRLKIAISPSLDVESADPKLRAYWIGQIARRYAGVLPPLRMLHHTVSPPQSGGSTEKEL